MPQPRPGGGLDHVAGVVTFCHRMSQGCGWRGGWGGARLSPVFLLARELESVLRRHFQTVTPDAPGAHVPAGVRASQGVAQTPRPRAGVPRAAALLVHLQGPMPAAALSVTAR